MSHPLTPAEQAKVNVIRNYAQALEKQINTLKVSSNSTVDERNSLEQLKYICSMCDAYIKLLNWAIKNNNAEASILLAEIPDVSDEGSRYQIEPCVQQFIQLNIQNAYFLNMKTGINHPSFIWVSLLLLALAIALFALGIYLGLTLSPGLAFLGAVGCGVLSAIFLVNFMFHHQTAKKISSQQNEVEAAVKDISSVLVQEEVNAQNKFSLPPKAALTQFFDQKNYEQLKDTHNEYLTMLSQP